MLEIRFKGPWDDDREKHVQRAASVARIAARLGVAPCCDGDTEPMFRLRVEGGTEYSLDALIVALLDRMDAATLAVSA